MPHLQVVGFVYDTTEGTSWVSTIHCYIALFKINHCFLNIYDLHRIFICPECLALVSTCPYVLILDTVLLELLRMEFYCHCWQLLHW